MVKLQVTNIKRNLSENNLRKIFEKYGTVTSCDLVLDSETGQSKGFAFVIFKNPAEAKLAVANLDKSLANGQKIKVKIKKL